MRIAIIDPFAGISGDMTLGSLVALAGNSIWLEELPAKLGVPEVGVRIAKTTRCSLSATKVDFHIPQPEIRHGHHHHHGRSVGELKAIVERSPLSTLVKRRASEVFGLIGEAEGRIHGVSPDEVHLHEVGALDALLDVVGVLVGFEHLAVETVYNLPVAIGDGWVDTAHGKLPVPAPATTILLEGLSVRDAGPVTGEATTPTGAALLKVLSQGRPPDSWRISASGWGAGERNPGAYPNALRVILAEEAPEAGVVDVLVTDIDDLSPEYIDPLRESLFAAGALDCAVWTTQGKKGRVSLRMEVLAAPSDAETVTEAIFRHSTTAGVRRWTSMRSTLQRHEHRITLQGVGSVRVKVLESPGGARIKPEYDDVLDLAAETGLPAMQIARMAEREAEIILEKKGYKFL